MDNETMKEDNYIQENSVMINENGEVKFLLTEESKRLGHVSIEEGKRLGHQIIDEILKANKMALTQHMTFPDAIRWFGKNYNIDVDDVKINSI